MIGITYDVRIYRVQPYLGTRVRSYRVRWKAGRRCWGHSFRYAAQAEVFRAELLTAARKGEAFDLTTGKPVGWQHGAQPMSWHDFACAYVDMKWNAASAKYRRAIAQALTAATVAMVADDHGAPDSRALRSALENWGYNTRQRAAGPADACSILAWVARNTRQVGELADPVLARKLLATATARLDGSRAAATSVHRNRAVLLNALDYAVELRLLAVNPGKSIKFRAPQPARAVDRRVVINPSQGRALLEAVRAQQPSGPRLAAFFGVLYYSGLRPEEAIGLQCQDIELPALTSGSGELNRFEPEDAWGVLYLRSARPDAGRRWTDNGSSRDRRGLKHRPEGEVRHVPCPPPLTRLLREHLARFGGHRAHAVFLGIHGRPLAAITYRRAWDRARRAAFSPQDYSSPLARRPYDLRHACLSTWLNAGVPPAQAAEWAGTSVELLLRVYAKSLNGQDDLAQSRIAAALGTSGHPPEPGRRGARHQVKISVGGASGATGDQRSIPGNDRG